MSRSSARYRRHAPEALESRVLLSAYPLEAIKQARAASHLDGHLTSLHDAVKSGQDFRQFVADQHLSIDDGGRVSVTVRARNVAAVSKALARIGFEPTASFPELHFVEGALPVGALGLLRGIKNVGRFAVRPSYAPISFAGAVNSQADFVMEADRARAISPGLYTGAGQRVGVISDSYATLPGAISDINQAIAAGDLPAGGVTVIEESPTNDTDEGRAMLELVHDLAPGASLAFATANGGEANFADNIRRLADPAEGNADVIVDDFGYFAEPMFQDGIIAQAIDEVVTTRGVNYFTSAGNQASRAYESTTFVTTNQTITFQDNSTLAGAFYDFDTGAGTDHLQHLIVPAGAQVLLSFQWNDPFYTASGVDTDLNVYLIDQSTNKVVSTGDGDNLFFQDPVEIISYTNITGSTKNLDLAIFRDVGPSPTRIKYVNYGSSSVTINQFATNSPTVLPHAAAAQGQGVAAAPYFNQDQPESFTSKGPATILFAPNGSPIAAQTRQSPQVTGIDGANTTFFGGSDTEGDGFQNFYGTSAAAPHVAAVAALVRQANPSFTPAQVYQRLQTTADDITATGAGFDTLTGFGLVNAFDAVYPTSAAVGLNFTDGLEGGVLPASYETYSTGPGRVRVTNVGTPFAGTRHLVLDTSITIQSPPGTNLFARNEVTLHVNLTATVGTKTLSFRQREYEDNDHPMPPSFTGSSDSDGVAFSVDGTNWFRLISLTGATDSTNTYTLRTFNLTAAAATAGVTLGADTRIRFQQYDNSPANSGNLSASDGIAFDDITITNTPFTGSIAGKTFLDSNSNTALDSGEPTISAATVYIDADNDGVLDPGEATSVSNSTGDYSFTNLANGTYFLKEVPPVGFISTNTQLVFLTAGESETGVNLSNQSIGDITFTGSANADTYLLRRSAGGGANYEIVITGGPTHVIPTQGVTSFTFDLAGGNDSLTVDYSNGIPVPLSGAVRYDGGGTAASDTDSLTVTGSSGADTFRIHNAEFPISDVQTPPRPIVLDDLTSTARTVETVTVNGNAGNDTLTTGESLGVPVVYNGGTETDFLNFSATSGNDTINNEIYWVTDGLTTVNFSSSLEMLTIYALDGTDTINVDHSAPVTQAKLGNGNDTVNLLAPGDAYQIEGGSGDDVLIASAGSTLSFPVAFIGEADNDSVTFQGQNANETINLSASGQITSPGYSGSLTMSSTESLNINTNAGVDTVNAASGSASFATITLDGGTSNHNDTFNVTPSQFTLFRVIGGPHGFNAPFDTLNITPAGATQSGVIIPSSEAGFDEIQYTNRQPVRFREIETLGSGIEFAPTIGSLSDSPDPVAGGENLTLTADAVADANGGTINVAFYRESNGVAGLQVGGDTLLGSDNSSPYAVAVPAPATPGAYTYYAQASDPGNLTSNVVSTTSTVIPAVSATPGVPDLLAVTDTGSLNTDDVTRLDNGTAGASLQFQVGGTVSGATVTLYAGAVVIGSVVASGATTTVTTNGTVDLADGINAITARQSEPGKTESPDSVALNVTIDTAVPTAEVVDVSPDPRTGGVASVTITFSRAVTGFDLADLSLKRDSGGNLLTGSQTLATSDNVTFTLNNLTGMTDTTGAYTLTLTASGSGVADALAGNALAAGASDSWAHALPAWLAPGSLATWNAGTHTLTVNGVTTIIADPGVDAPTINASSAAAVLTIDPASDLVVRAASLNLSNGATATIASLGGARTAAYHRVLVVNALDIEAGSSLDITDNDVIVDYTGSNPIAGVEADVVSAYNVTGDWLGDGITSSVAQLNGNYAVAVADNAVLPAPFGAAQGGPLFGGQDVDLTAVLIKFTHRADINLDGLNTPDDSAIFGGNYDEASFANWATGDLNYDGLFTPDDAAIFGGSYDESLPQL